MTEEKGQWFKAELSLGTALTIGLSVLTTVLISWININTRITVVEQRMKMYETQLDHYSKMQNDNYRQLEDFKKDVMDELKTIQISLENKMNRP